MAEQEAPSPSDIVSKVEKKGDTLDAIKGLTSKPRRGVLATAGAFSAPMFSEIPNYKFGLHLLLPYAEQSAFAGVLFGVLYGVGKIRERGRVNAAEKLQDEFRELTGEPVDLIRTREKHWKKGGSVLLRWYGLEETGAGAMNASSFRERLTALIDIAELSGIKEIVMGTTTISDVMQRQAESTFNFSDFGRVVEASELLSEVKKMPKHVDDLAKNDRKLLVTSLDQARTLASEFKGVGDIYKSLAEIIEDSQIALLADQWQQSTTDDDAIRLQNALGDRIAREYAENKGTGSRIARGNPDRYDDFYRVADGVLTGTTVAEGGLDARVISPRNLFSLVGIQTDAAYTKDGLSQLLDTVFTEGAEEASSDRKFRAMIAFYELVRRNLTETERMSLQEHVGDKKRGKKETLYQRVKQQPPRTVPFLKRLGRNATDETATVEYKNTKRLRRLTAAGVLALAVSGASYGSGEGFSGYTNYLYDQAGVALGNENDEYFGTLDERRDYALENYDTGWMLEAGYFLRKAQHDAELALTTYAYHAGVPYSLLDKIAHNMPLELDPVVEDIPQKRFITPGSIELTPGQTTETGDVDLRSNYELYRVTPLGDQSPSGYWYTNVFDTISLTNTTEGSGTYPYSDVKLGYTLSSEYQNQDVQVPIEVDPDNVAGKLLYKVTAHYAGSADNFVTAPVKSGTRIVAARVIERDKGSNGKIMPVTVHRNGTTGVYKLAVGDTSGLELPVVEYFLAAEPNDVVRGQGQMKIGVFATEIDENQAEKVKTALGLPPDADEKAIAAAVRMRQYSFTPVADSRNPSHARGNETDHEVLANIAAGYASLPEGNCNTSATTTIVADRGVDENIGVGFYVSADGIMSQGNSHMWVTETDGTIIDNTPVDSSPYASGGNHDTAESVTQIKMPPVQEPVVVEPPPPKEEPPNPLTDLGLVLGGAAVGTLAYRRRKQLLATIQEGKTKYMAYKMRMKYFDKNTLGILNIMIHAPAGSAITAEAIERLPNFQDDTYNPEDEMKKILQIYPKGISEDQWENIMTRVLETVSAEDFNRRTVKRYLKRIKKDWNQIHKYLLSR